MNELTFLTRVMKETGWLSRREIRLVWAYRRQCYRPTTVAGMLRTQRKIALPADFSAPASSVRVQR